MPAAPSAPPPSSAPVQPAPSAPPPAAPKPSATAPKAPAPAPKQAPKVTPPAPTPTPAKPAAPKDQWEDSFAALDKVASPGLREKDETMGEGSERPTEQPKVEDKQEQATDGEEQKSPEKADDEMSVKEQPKAGNKKPNPWTLVETYKSKNHQLQQELAELRTKSGEPPERSHRTPQCHREAQPGIGTAHQVC